MATYAIGDVQGCYTALTCLLEGIHFDRNKDTLWFAGDLINRGPQSLDTLRFIKDLGDAAICVLGNHDLHLIATVLTGKQSKKYDTFDDIIAADDCHELIDWLRRRPIIHHDSDLGYTMVHAGVPPQWSITEAQSLAREVEETLQSDNVNSYLFAMYGNKPECWKEELAGTDRLRVITNYLTRMRFCTKKGVLDLDCKTKPEDAPEKYAPWYSYENRKTINDKIIFGHWAALEGQTNTKNVYALDTGCVWGGKLTAMRLEDEVLYSCQCDHSP